MPAPGTDLKQRLFQLRFGPFYDDTGKDLVPELLESLRPFVKTDERVRVALLRSAFVSEMYLDGRRILELLLDELPDSPQVRFVLGYFAYQPLGEDGMSTQSPHRIMAKRFAEDPWFRRFV